MLTFKDSFVVCVILNKLNKVKNLKIYRYFATLSMTSTLCLTAILL